MFFLLRDIGNDKELMAKMPMLRDTGGMAVPRVGIIAESFVNVKQMSIVRYDKKGFRFLEAEALDYTVHFFRRISRPPKPSRRSVAGSGI